VITLHVLNHMFVGPTIPLSMHPVKFQFHVNCQNGKKLKIAPNHVVVVIIADTETLPKKPNLEVIVILIDSESFHAMNSLAQLTVNGVLLDPSLLVLKLVVLVPKSEPDVLRSRHNMVEFPVMGQILKKKIATPKNVLLIVEVTGYLGLNVIASLRLKTEHILCLNQLNLVEKIVHPSRANSNHKVAMFLRASQSIVKVDGVSGPIALVLGILNRKNSLWNLLQNTVARIVLLLSLKASPVNRLTLATRALDHRDFPVGPLH